MSQTTFDLIKLRRENLTGSLQLFYNEHKAKRAAHASKPSRDAP